MGPIGQEPKGARVQLLPHHSALADTALNPTGKRIILLHADVGLGKSTALAALAGRLLQAKPSARALLLVPGALRDQFSQTFQQVGTPSLLVDRYKFREMVESALDDEIWPRGAITILSPDFAKQADILESLTQTSWDLVIADEAHGLKGARADAIRRIAASAERVVLASAMVPELSNPFEGEDATVIEWRRDRIVDHGSTSGPILHEIPFTLTTAELSLRDVVNQFNNLLRENSKSERFIEDLIIRRLVSSPPALENTLRRLVKMPVTGVDLIRSPEYLDEEEPEDYSGFLIHFERSGELTRIATQVLRNIEQISDDSKLNVFGELIVRLSTEPKTSRVCVLTEYVETLFYLLAEVEDRNLNYIVLHGGMSIEDRQRSLTSFGQSEAMLVATVAALQGTELAVTDLVLYDTPRSKPRLYSVLVRFRELSGEGQLHLYVFKPVNERIGPLQSLRDMLDKQMFSS